MWMNCSMLCKLSIFQAWVGLHFSVLTQRVLHNGKILLKFFYDFLWFVMLFLLVQGRWRLKPLCLGCMYLYVSMAQQQGMVATLSYPAFVGPSLPVINTQQSSPNSFNEFGIWPKWLLPLLHFGDLGGAITCYFQIDQNGTVGTGRGKCPNS